MYEIGEPSSEEPSSRELSTKQTKNIRFSNGNKGNKEEHCEDDLNNMLPENQHRGDIVSSSRMLAYCDTVMATCATFLVLPLRNVKLLNDQMHEKTSNLTSSFVSMSNSTQYDETKILQEYFVSKYKEFILFFLGFFIVLSIWENMNIRSIVVKRVDDFILTLVIFEMLVTTVLPFSLALQGYYYTEKTPILITCVVLAILQIIDIGIVLYSINSPKMLHVELKNWTKRDLRELTMIMIFRPLTSLIIIIIGGSLSYVHYALSWTFIALLTLMPTIRKLFWYVRRRMNKFEKTMKDSFLLHFSKGSISKERVETVSDGAIAIVACIIIVDITVEVFPKLVDNDKHKVNLKSTLKELTPEFLRFLGIFCLVSALWYINHTVLHLFKKINSIMFYFQKCFLAFCCLCPFSGSMLITFADKKSIVAIELSAVIVFLSSTANFFMLIYGLKSETKYLHDWASMAHFQNNKRQHLYTLVKVLNIPFWTLVCIFGILVSRTAVPYLLGFTVIAVPCSFFVAKLILMNHVGKAASYIRKTFIRKLTSRDKKSKKLITKEEMVLNPVHSPESYSSKSKKEEEDN